MVGCAPVLLFVLVLAQAYELPNNNCIERKSLRICFTLNSSPLTFHDARRSCEETHSLLATISEPPLQEFVLDYLRKVSNKSTAVWIGLYWSHGLLRWVSGYQVVPITYLKDTSGDVNGKCIAISTDGYWTPDDCGTPHSFLCASEERVSYVSPPFSNHSRYECPTQFHLLDRRCFRFFVDQMLTYREAESACKELNSHLLTIRSFREQDLLVAMLSDYTSDFWLGLRRNFTKYIWSNSGEVEASFTNWVAGEPNGDAFNNCTIMHMSAHNLGRWSAFRCSSRANFVCEIEPYKATLFHSNFHGSLFLQGRCASGFYEYRSACYTVIELPSNVTRNSNLFPDTVTEACKETVLLKNCTSLHVGTALCPIVMTPHNHLDAAYQRSLIDWFADSVKAWVGLKANRHNLYLDAPGRLESTALLGYTIRKLPNNQTTCIGLHVDRMLLSAEPCDSHLPAMCGYYLDTRSLLPSWPPQTESKPKPPKCPIGNWKLFAANCYHLGGINNGRGWHDAEVACLQLGGHLVSIVSMAEDAFVRSLLPSKQPIKPWIGLKVFIEADLREDPLMQWSDGSPVSYSLLSIKKNSSKHNECAQLGSVNGKNLWTLADDCKELAPFVCKTPAASTTVEWDARGPDHCLPESHPQFCFSVNHTAVKFVHAISACQAAGKHLATILDDSQQDFITRAYRTFYSSEWEQNVPTRYWIGLLRSQETLQWVSGYPAVPNVYWKTGSTNSDRMCAYVDTGLDTMMNWGTANCEEKYPFLCSTIPPLSQNLSTPRNLSIDRTNTSCPLGFLYVSAKCYKVQGDGQNNFTYAEATSKCSRSGGQLVSISSMYEQDIISVLVAERFLSFWIGLITDVGSRKWANGALLTYTNWMKGYPKRPDYENPLCTYVHNLPTHVGRWAEANCGEKMGFICETQPLLQQTATLHLFTQEDCAPGFFHHRGACYMVLHSFPLPIRSASQFYDSVSDVCAATSPSPLPCEKARGLAGCPVTMTPHSRAEAAFMRLLVAGEAGGGNTTQVWTGLKIFFNNSIAIPQTEDGANLGIFDIDFGRQIDVGATYTCFVLRTTQNFLSSIPCFSFAPAICGYYLDTHLFHTQLASANYFACPTGTERVGRNCFSRVDVAKKMSWRDAEEYCTTFYQGSPFETVAGSVTGHLPSVHDLLTLNFMRQLHEKEPIWLGLTSSEELRSTTSGLSLNTFLQWSDGSAVDYLAFSNGVYGQSGLALFNDDFEICVVLDPESGFWKKAHCFERFPFVCQFPIDAFPKHRPVGDFSYLPVVNSCPTNFSLSTEDGCFMFVETRTSLKDAQTFCSTLHPYASLASIHSKKEENDLLALMSEHKLKGNYWIGLVRVDLHYSWIDASEVDHLPKLTLSWDLYLRRLQDCFTFGLLFNATPTHLIAAWQEMNCDAKQPFICQIYRTAQGPRVVNPSPPPLPDLPLLRCPHGYRQHEDRCFKFFPTTASFSDAEDVCKRTVKDTGFVGSLARISNPREQDFVAGLFAANAPRQPSMAWIGLRHDGKRWTDGTTVTFFRERISLLNCSDENCECTSLLYSSNVQFYGLWSRSLCSVSDQIYFVCQAVPISTASVTVDPTTELENMGETELVCGDGYTLGFFNRTALTLGESLPSPHCLQLVSTSPLSWQDARILCKDQSASLPTIDTLADLSFLRVWLQTPRSLGGAGLDANTSIWLDLRVAACPNCFSNWLWHAGESDEAPVLLTDWVNAPHDPSGCYIFGINSLAYHPSTSYFRSMRPAFSCTNITLPVVCQKTPHPPLNNSKTFRKISSSSGRHLFLRNLTSGSSPVTVFLANRNVARSGRRCVRWDLVQLNLNLSDMAPLRRHRALTSDIAYSEHVNPFWGSNCAHLALEDTRGHTVYRYACYTSTDPNSGLEDCDMESRGTGSLPLGWITFGTILCLLLAVIVVLCAVKGYNRQRCCTPQNRWHSLFKVTANSSIFGDAIIAQHRQHHRVFYSNGSGGPGAASIKMFDPLASDLIASYPSPTHPIAPSLTFKHRFHRTLRDRDPLLLDEPDNADEFSGPA